MTHRIAWTQHQIDAVRQRYPNESTAAIAAEIGRTATSVYQRAYMLGLKKSDTYLASELACRLTGEAGAAKRFAKGMTPWNKGIKWDSGGRSAEARFKPGSKPSNTQPVGSYRVTKDGTLSRKVCEAAGSNSKRWRGVHELVWVAANGPVPAKHIVVFKPGMRTAKLEEITIERVECISLADNMRRNTVHNLPKELALVCQLKGALNRQINKRAAQ